jgi:biotin-dependent carboxylase-like uncharacterized protein
MPVAGVMDRFAYNFANTMAGNQPGAAVLEMTLRGATFRFETDSYVSVCGANMQGMLNDRRIKPWSSFHIPAGSELSFGYAVSGCRAYLAVNGGMATSPVMGSRSTYARAAIGGHEGRALQPGDKLAIGEGRKMPAGEKIISSRILPCYGNEIILRVIPGPQDDHFTAAGIETFFNSTYTVTSRNDRMGFTFEGPVIEHRSGPDIVSDAVYPGAVQVPGRGMPIVMMMDCQTTGGYPKIGTVIGADLCRLAQAKAGNKVYFTLCSDAEAVALLREEHQHYSEFAATMSLHMR